MSSPRCPKCGAGMAALGLRSDLLECGQRIESVVCGLCSYRLAERAVVTRAVSAEDRESQAFDRVLPRCEVVGCHRVYYRKANKLPWCSDHRKKMAEWEKTRRLSPAPVIEVDGLWMDNPDRARREPSRQAKRKGAARAGAALG